MGSTNLGDELVFSSLTQKLRARDIDVVAVSLDTNATVRDHNVRALHHLDAFGLLRALSSVGAVILGGGGLLQDSTSPFNLPYHLARPVVARWRRRPVAAIGVGAGPLEAPTARWLVRHGLRRVAPITVRDIPSRTMLRHLGLEARTTADLAFGLNPPSKVEPHRLVVCLRPWSGGHHLTPARFRGTATPDWFVPAAARALDGAAATLGLPVHFVALQRDRDHPLHEAVARQMRTPATFATPGVHEVVEEIGTGSVVVSMRYHGVVCAALAGRPSVAIGYSPKVEALAADLDPAVQLVPWSADGLAGVAEAVSAVAPHAADAVDGRERLRARERGNDDAIDELLSR